MIDYFLTWTDDLLGHLHLISASCALFFGAVVAVIKKGTRVHIVSGYLYLIAMLTVNISALLKYDLTGAPNMFHFFAFFSLATLGAGYAFALRRRRTGSSRDVAAHGALMLWSYFGLLVALLAEVFTRGFPFMLHGDHGWVRFMLALGAFMAVTGFVMRRFIRHEIAKTLRSSEESNPASGASAASGRTFVPARKQH